MDEYKLLLCPYCGGEAARKRIQELELVLLDMLEQVSTSEDFFMHTFMSCDENAYELLGIEYGESINAVRERFKKKWEQGEHLSR